MVKESFGGSCMKIIFKKKYMKNHKFFFKNNAEEKKIT